jgi:hypothetical protein
MLLGAKGSGVAEESRASGEVVSVPPITLILKADPNPDPEMNLGLGRGLCTPVTPYIDAIDLD